MQRLFIVYNPQSTKAGKINDEVIKPARGLSGFLVGKFAVKKGPVTENAGRLARLLEDGDIIATAGGDGTTEVGVNAAMMSGKDARLLILPYGNFNDIARMFGAGSLEDMSRAEIVKAYPIKMKVNGEDFQYAMGYFTAGMMAEAAEMLNSGAERKHLKQNKNNTFYALKNAVKWFFKNRKCAFLPGVIYNGKAAGDMTEYMAINSGTVAKIMKVKPMYGEKRAFYGGVLNLKSFWKMAGFGMRGMISGIKLPGTGGDKLEFTKETEVMVQSEGECVRLKGVRELEFSKTGRAVKIYKI